MLSHVTQFASVLGVPVEAAEIELRAAFPMDGDYGLAETKGTAMERLSYTLRIESAADAGRVAALIERVESGCYALNSLRVPVEVAREVRLNGDAISFTPPVPPELGSR